MKKGTKIAALLLGLSLVIPACTPASPKSSEAPADTSAPASQPASDPASQPASQPSSQPASQPSSVPASVPSSQPASSTPAPSSEAPVNYVVTISNKEELSAEWFVGDASRKVNISTEPRANVAQLISEGKIEITSSDPTVLSIAGQMANPVSAGSATIKVKCGASEDTVAITLQAKLSNKEKFGVAHEGTADDPFDNEDALAVAKSDKYNKEDFYVRGEIASFYHAPGARTDGAVSWFLKPAEGKTEKFEVYKCYKDGTGEASYLTDDDVWVGGIATAHGRFTVYNGQYETDGAKFVKCEGTKPEARKTLEKTFAEVMAAGALLDDGADTYDYYKFSGFVTAREGTNYWLTATKGEALVAGKSDEAHGAKDIYTNGIELYNVSDADVAAKLLENAEVEVTMIVKNYHGTIENLLALKADDVNVLQAGTAWAVPEPAVANKTIAEFKALENKADKAYVVKGTVKDWNGAEAAKSEFGNMTLTDGENDLTIYGASATETALAWDKASSYAFTNPKDFLTNEVTAALNIGDEVTMKLIRADYNGAIQGKGVITKVVPAGEPAPTIVSLAKYHFVSKSATFNNRSIDEATAGGLFHKLAGADLFKEVTAVTNVYEGANGGSADAGTAFEITNILKLGKSKTAGEIKFSLNKEVSKIVVTGDAWTATASVTINGTKVDAAFSENIINKDAITDGKLNNAGTLSFEFEASKDITIAVDNTNSKANFGVVFDSIEFFGEEGGETPVETKEAMVWYTEGEGNQAIHFEGAGIWTWVKYDELGYADFNAFNAAKDSFVVAYESEPAATVVDKVVSDDNATLKYARVYVVLSAAYNTGVLTLTIPGADGKTYEGTLEFAEGVLVKVNGEALAQPVAQPVGAFRGLAKTAAATFIPVDLVLAADSAALSVNGEAANVTSYVWDNVDTLSIVTDGAYGTITAKFADNVFTITGLTGAAAAQLDSTFAVQLSGNCQFIDCGAMTLDQMNATFIRRYDRNDNAGWQINNPSDGRISAVTVAGRAGLQCNGFSSGKVGFTLKSDLPTPIPGNVIKSLGCWIYNPGETSFQMTLYAYKSANRGSNGVLNTFTIEPGWHFYQSGVVNGGSFTSSDSFYNFQFYYQNVSVNPVFDDLCIYM